MNIDLTKLITGMEEEIIIDESLAFPEEKLKNTRIKELKNINFKGTISKILSEK